MLLKQIISFSSFILASAISKISFFLIFLYIEIDNNYSKIFYVENDSLKYVILDISFNIISKPKLNFCSYLRESFST